MLKEILLLNPIYVTVFWAVALSFHNRKRHMPKVFLSWFMGIASIIYLSHYYYFTGQYTLYFYFDSLYILANLLVFPLYHVYVRLLTVDRTFSLKVHGKFLAIPILFFLLMLVGYIFAGRDLGTDYIINILVDGEEPAGIHNYLNIVFILGRITFVLQTIFFLYLNFRLIQRNNLRLQNYYSNMDERKLTWVQFFNFCFAFTTTSSVIVGIVGRNIFLQNDWLLVFPSSIFSLMLFFIGLLGHNQKAVYVELENLNETYEEGKPTLHLKPKLERLLEKDRIFKNPDLKIWDVSSMLGTNRTYVSKIINSEYGRNFNSHINHYRVMYAKSLITNNKNLINEQIAELSGFGSVNSLYRAFLAVEKVSLGQYRKSMGI